MSFRPLAVRWLRRTLRGLTDGRVVAGPFAGLAYLADSVGSVFNPKLLGTYERELWPVLESLPALRLERVVDIGAAEGFYAVGLARWLDCPVVAYEQNAGGRELLAGLAAANGVATRVTIRGRCERDDLAGALDTARRTLVVCDVEGFEDVLLDLAAVPDFAAAWLLVETHDGQNPGVTARLAGRFAGTHAVQTLHAQPRTAADFPREPWWAAAVPPALRVRLMDEGRTDGRAWLWLQPRQPPPPR
jgi:hypothetical protein